jgi:CRISPR system Cascade subunit CasA
MTYDLRSECWIPWRRRNGSIEWGSPALIADAWGDNPIVAVAAPRPDFGGAIEEFLIGLLTIALQPEDEQVWFERWRQPPTTGQVQRALESLPPAFDLEGDGPRAFQDLSVQDLARSETSPIEHLLVDAAGDQTVRLNKDLFIKRDRFERLGRPAAAMALITMQTYAPAGGQGHRTSLRGGGPLTTLVDPRVDVNGVLLAGDRPLWQKLWANVQTRDQWETAVPDNLPGLPTAFPWLSRTRTSEGKPGRLTTPTDVHPLQAYFGLPRRIRLEFDGPGTCGLTGRADERTVVGFRMKNYGTEYTAWRHPLSPYYWDKKDAEWRAVHGQSGGIAWRDWVGLAFRTPEGASREPAPAVAAFNRRAGRLGLATFRVHAFGYDFDNMKARSWIEASMPSFAVADPFKEQLVRDTAIRLTDATGYASTVLLGQVKRALFENSDEVPGDLSAVKGELWAATEQAFYDAIGAVVRASESPEDVPDAVCREFLPTLVTTGTSVFDRWCPSSGSTPTILRRIVSARYSLVMTLRGYSPLGEKLFGALRIPLPGGGRAARKAAKGSRKGTAR